MSEPTQTLTLGDPNLNLQVMRQHTDITVMPTSLMGGTYDSAEITTVFVVNNPSTTAQDVRFIVPYTSPAYSASIAVISAGVELYRKRNTSLAPIDKDYEAIKPYLEKLGMPVDQYDTAKELKAVAGQFRAGTVTIPAGVSTIKVQLSVVVNPSLVDGVKKFTFKVFTPLPGIMTPTSTALDLTVSARFVADQNTLPSISEPQCITPTGDPTHAEPYLPQQLHGSDYIYFWRFKYDPIIVFEYTRPQ